MGRPSRVGPLCATGTKRISFGGSSAARKHLAADRDCSSEVIERRPIRLLLKYFNYEI